MEEALMHAPSTCSEHAPSIAPSNAVGICTDIHTDRLTGWGPHPILLTTSEDNRLLGNAREQTP